MEMKVTVSQQLVYAHLVTNCGTDCFTFENIQFDLENMPLREH